MMSLDAHAAGLLAAFHEFEHRAEASALSPQAQPSALLLLVRPGQTPNSATRIVGDPDILSRLLLAMLADPRAEAFRTVLIHYLEQLTDGT